MAKIPFDIKYRPQIESGEYKVMLDCGVEAEILAWDKPGEYPIVCMAKKEGAIPFRTDNDGVAYHYPEGSNYSDLFIITPEPELSEFRMKVNEFAETYELAATDSESWEYKTCNGNLQLIVDKYAAELLALARKEMEEELKEKVLHDYWKQASDQCIQARKEGKAEALKDLPRWRKWGNGACGNGQGIPIAIIKRWLHGYQLVDALGVSGEQYIMLSDLEKLPKED